MNLWKRLPLHMKILIVSHIAIIFFVLLLVLSMCGGIDEADRQIEQSNISSVYFDVEVNGETQSLTALNESGKQFSTEKITLITRQAVRLDDIMFETDKLSVSTNAVISRNDVTYSWELSAGAESHSYTFETPLDLVEGERITIELSEKTIFLCVFVTCENAETTP